MGLQHETHQSEEQESEPFVGTSTYRSSRRANVRSSLGRYTEMLLLSLVGAAAIITVVVIATPVQDPQPVDSRPAQGNDSSPTTNQPTTNQQSTANPEANGDAPQAANSMQPGDASGPNLSVPAFAELGLPPPEAETDEELAARLDVERVQNQLLTLAQTLETNFPDDSHALHIAAISYNELKRTQQAMATWQKCVQSEPPAAGPYSGLARLYTESGQEQQAIAVLENALARDIHSEELYQQLGAAYESLGELEQAAEWLSQGTQAYSQDAKLWLDLGRVQNQLGNYSAAEEAIRKGIDLGEADEAALFALSQALTRQQKSEAATAVRQQLADLRAAKASQPPDFQNRYAVTLAEIAKTQFLAAADLSRQLGNYPLAEEWVRQTLDWYPNNLQAYMVLSSIYRQQGNLGAALTLHRKILELQPENMLNYMNLASIALQLGDVATAEQTLQQAIIRDPAGVAAHASLARLYLASGREALALPLAEHVQRHNQSVESYVLLAQVLEANGRIEEAVAAVTKAKSLNPNHPLLKR